jgi:hypothetical protein
LVVSNAGLFTLDWLLDKDLRQRVTTGLNKGKLKNTLAYDPLPRRSLLCASLALVSLEAFDIMPNFKAYVDRGTLRSRHRDTISLGRASISMIFFCSNSFSTLRTSLA